MEKLIFRTSQAELPEDSGRDTLTVLMYCNSDDTTKVPNLFVGKKLPHKLKQLHANIPSRVLDFLTIALAIVTADTFVLRSNSENNWCRQMHLDIGLSDPSFWDGEKDRLQQALAFLSGDVWDFTFTQGEYPFKFSEKVSSRSKKHIDFGVPDCICLFSGGLDSAIGAIDLYATGHKPLLVSHSYKGDKKHQDLIVKKLKKEFGKEKVQNLQLLAAPTGSNQIPGVRKGGREITMRTRSISFLAFGLLAAASLRDFQSLFGHVPENTIDLFVPENGFISINPPLTSRRLGSHSTHTTHPQFIAGIQKIWNNAGFNAKIVNPYQFKTKGEMCLNCKDFDLLKEIVSDTVSCSHWKRRHKQCGICLPCLIRRAALVRANIEEDSANYENVNIRTAYDQKEVRDKKKDDIKSIISFIKETKELSSIKKKLIMSGLTPDEDRTDYLALIQRGRKELKTLLNREKLKVR